MQQTATRGRKHTPLDSHQHRKHFWNNFKVVKRKGKMIRVQLDEKDMQYAEDFAQRVIEEKKKEFVHQKDAINDLPRWMVGVLGEVALGKFLGVPIHDSSVGETTDYSVPDLYEPLGIRCGIKSFRLGNFPLTNRIHRKKQTSLNAYPQIFIGIDMHEQVAYIYGVGSVDTLVRNERDSRNDRFVKDANALKRKVAFTKLGEMQSFRDKDSLETLVSDMQWSQTLKNLNR